jgi:hypothetical protein
MACALLQGGRDKGTPLHRRENPRVMQQTSLPIAPRALAAPDQQGEEPNA